MEIKQISEILDHSMYSLSQANIQNPLLKAGRVITSGIGKALIVVTGLVEMVALGILTGIAYAGNCIAKMLNVDPLKHATEDAFNSLKESLFHTALRVGLVFGGTALEIYQAVRSDDTVSIASDDSNPNFVKATAQAQASLQRELTSSCPSDISSSRSSLPPSSNNPPQRISELDFKPLSILYDDAIQARLQNCLEVLAEPSKVSTPPIATSLSNKVVSTLTNNALVHTVTNLSSTALSSASSIATSALWRIGLLLSSSSEETPPAPPARSVSQNETVDNISLSDTDSLDSGFGSLADIISYLES